MKHGVIATAALLALGTWCLPATADEAGNRQGSDCSPSVSGTATEAGSGRSGFYATGEKSYSRDQGCVTGVTATAGPSYTERMEETFNLSGGTWVRTEGCTGHYTCGMEICPDGETRVSYIYRQSDGSEQTIGADCAGPPDDSDGPQLTIRRVANAFRNLPLPAADLHIEPPNGWTLVNLPTLFHTTQGNLDRSVTLLGQNIDFRITPAKFTWTFGDGNTLTTTRPGKPYNENVSPRTDEGYYISHPYRTKDTVNTTLDVTYTADWRVNGGGWQPVPGSVTIDGDPQQLEIRTARPKLVD